jgi:hypothetical protein
MHFFGEAEPCKAIFRESFVKTDRAVQSGADLEYFAEDSTFFADAKGAGFTSWVDPQSYIGHVGEKVFKTRLDDRWEIAETPEDVAAEGKILEARLAAED